MKSNILVFIGLLYCLFYSSCGVISKARYGNGYKLNLEWGKDEKPEYVQAKKAEKRQALIYNKTNTGSIESTIEQNEIDNLVDTLAYSNIKKLNLKPKKKFNKKSAPDKKKDKEKLPYEKHVETGAFLFYIGLFINVISGFTFPILLLLVVLGVVFAIIGLFKIKNNKNKYRGKIHAIVIIILFFNLLIGFLYLYYVLLPFIFK